MAKLFVICGHGAGDPGACGNGYEEAERVRKLGQRIKDFGGDNVILGDINRNFYADAGIEHLNIPKDTQIIELHMDAAAASARGAHVIIHITFNPDTYDLRLANFFSALFPGRSSSIVGRANLANPTRAKNMGYPYRLVECGFITNPTDVQIFNNNIDNIAKGVLDSFGITTSNKPSKPSEDKPADKPVVSHSIKLGDRVGVNKEANDYNGTKAGGVKRGIVCYTVDELKGDRAVLDVKGICTPFNVKDLFKDGSVVQPSKPTVNQSINLGDKVGVNPGASDYNGSPAGGVTRGKVCYTVDELKGDRAVLDVKGICTPFRTKDLFKNGTTVKPNKTINLGDRVGVNPGAPDYNGSPAGGVTRGKICYTVDELKGDRAVLDVKGICTPFHTKDLFK